MLVSLIPTRIHGVLDYLVGLLLIAAPWLFQFANDRPAMMVAVILGAGTIVYSLMTDYELGLVHVLPMRAHLFIDLLAGLLLVVSPWLLGFAGRIIWPHVTVGVMEILIVLISSPTPTSVRSSPDSAPTGGNTGIA